MRGTLITIIRIAFTYIGTVVGAGFASGQEIFQFFTIFGRYGFWAILLSIILFSWLGTRMMIFGSRLNATSYIEFNAYLFGPTFGRWMNFFMGIILFGVITAMLSGTGSMAEEQIGVSFHLGIWVTSILSILVILKGMEGILSINSFVVPLMFFFTFLVGYYCMSQKSDQLGIHILMYTEKDWILSAIIYVAFNLAMSQAVLVPLGAEIKNEKILFFGGWAGGIGLGLMLLINNLAMQVHFYDVKELEIPMAFVISTLGVGIKIFFLSVMWGEIFTTLVGNVYGLAATLKEKLPIRLPILIIVIFIVSYLFALIGFPTLISYLYPSFGYLGLITLVLLMIRKKPATGRG